ncbi:PspA/IM30 family protein [Reinekea blandensis]|uniref:PspA/IM30 family protein n=1 Tax=Reinekea blandensis MED297 TaxID=314283 RepID=A4BJ77_9GAMM|nr:PspA/IM30 family protein [Reinekea blandensis]EAR07830.1 hypothetical protein MED297_05279 [Reinekea sp. MED297] [Reinekea blandensis MED297]
MLSKLISLLKRSVVEISSAVGDVPETVDQQQDHRLEASIARSQSILSQAETAFRTMESTEQSLVQRLDKLEREQQHLQTQARSALQAGQETQAAVHAQQISECRHQMQSLQTELSEVSAQTARARYQLNRAQSDLGELLRERDMLTTSQTMHQTTLALRDHLAEGTESLTNARASVERIRARQQRAQDQWQAETDLQQSQDTKLQYQQAGIVWDDDSPDAILAQLKKETNHGKP